MNDIALIQMDPPTVKVVNKNPQLVQLHPANQPNSFYISKSTLEYLQEKRVKFNTLKSYPLKEAPIKILFSPHFSLYETPTYDAITEAAAYALSLKGKKKSIQISYQGRHGERQKALHKNAFYLDRPGGKRLYLWNIEKQKKTAHDIRELFPNLVESMQDPDTKVILSLGSGGIRLYAHAAVMKFLNMLGLRDHIDEVWGCSGGALAGLPYAWGIEPETIEEEGFHLYNDRYSMRLSPHKLGVVKNLLVDHLFPNSNNMLNGFLNCQEDLKNIFGKHFKRVKNQPNIKTIPFYCVAFNIDTQRLEILTPETPLDLEYPTPIYKANGMDAIIASSSIPIVYVPKKIMRGKKAQHYIDGGMVEEVPLISPFQKWNQEKQHKLEKRDKLLILYVNLFPHFSASEFFGHWFIKRLPTSRLLHVFAKYTDMIRDAHISESKKILKQKEGVTILELCLPLKDASVLDPLMIPKVIKTAKESFFNQLLNIESELAIKRRH